VFVCSRSIFYVCSSSLFIGESLNPFTQEFALKLFEVAAQCDQIILIQERHVVLAREPVVLGEGPAAESPLVTSRALHASSGDFRVSQSFANRSTKKNSTFWSNCLGQLGLPTEHLSDPWAPGHAGLCVWKPERKSFTHGKSHSVLVSVRVFPEH
jgi:hypothetical protein